MSIQSDLETFCTVSDKIRAHRAEIKELMKLRNEVETKIKEYLRVQELPGVLYKGSKILLNEKVHRQREKRAVADERIFELLRNNGVADPTTVIKQLKNSNVITKHSLIIKK